eukprot:15430270-Alexandrium_andersonii.AAC.1
MRCPRARGQRQHEEPRGRRALHPRATAQDRPAGSRWQGEQRGGHARRKASSRPARASLHRQCQDSPWRTLAMPRGRPRCPLRPAWTSA